MKKTKKLAESEVDIMNAVWAAKGRITVRETLETLYPNGEKAYTTVQTIMNILVEKGFLKKQKIGMVNFYTAKVRREHAVKNETQSLVSRIFHGSFGALATHLIKSGELSQAELKKLKQLIDEQQDNGAA